jgi:L1 cell adhesion molecule like protein
MAQSSVRVTEKVLSSSKCQTSTAIVLIGHLIVIMLSFFAFSAYASDDHSGTIGIDFKITFSCVATFANGRVKIIANNEGKHITPSVVSFCEKSSVIGEFAVRQFVTNPANTIFSIKCLIGLSYFDERVQQEIQRLPYKIVNRDGRLYIEIRDKNEVNFFLPEEISAQILLHMKAIAEDFIGHPVMSTVVTVSAYFNKAQCQATMDAATIAGLNVSRLLSEPTAACFAYGRVTNSTESRTLLVFDLGGGTFNVSMMNATGRSFTVKTINGSTHLGGEDLD